MARKVVWGIDIGQTALRAVKAVNAGDRIAVLAFDSIEYDEMLSAPDVDRDSTIQQALRTFLARNRLSATDVILTCIPGQSALIRFIKLPPVERKRVPDIVRYEAHQQIPFPLEEVVWDYKPLEKTAGPIDQVEVGIFAMRRDIVHGFLSNLMVCNLDVDVLQLAPMALYNYVAYDQPGGTEANIVIDMGAENTELLIASGTSVWPRSLPISGNDFTEAIMEKFKVPFGKAEALKRMAKQSKYSKQIYQAMEAPLRRVVEEVQRSIGYYKSINPGVRISGIYALGGSFKLPGMGKYISERLHIPIRSLTEPQNFDMSGARNPRAFQESSLSYGIALGLVVQGCEMAAMDISLLPQELLQRKIIARKKPWAALVAACALLMFATAYFSTWERSKELKEANSKPANDFVAAANKRIGEWEADTNVGTVDKKLKHIRGLWEGRDFWLHAMRKLLSPIVKLQGRDKGPWLRKVASVPVEFDATASAIAEGVTKDLQSGLGFTATGVEIDGTVISKMRSATKAREAARTREMMAKVMKGAQRPVLQEEEEVNRPDCIYVVLQGQTTHRDKGVYVTDVLVNKLTNMWVNDEYEVEVESLRPPEDYTVPLADGKTVKLSSADWKLKNPPLVADVRFVNSKTERRFVDKKGRVIKLEGLPEKWQSEYSAIQKREDDVKNKRIRNWEDWGPDEVRLRSRDLFLAALDREEEVLEEEFTDFEVALFLDPSGELLKEVDRLKKEQAAQPSTIGGRPVVGRR